MEDLDHEITLVDDVVKLLLCFKL